jgi:short-subunit dehydrogenase
LQKKDTTLLVLSAAGASQHALSWQTSAGVTQELLALNAAGPMLLTRAALPHLIRRLVLGASHCCVCFVCFASLCFSSGTCAITRTSWQKTNQHQSVKAQRLAKALLKGEAHQLTQCCNLYCQSVCRRKGRLVVVASMAALVPSPGQAVYSAAKMALRGYFSSVATEVADTWVAGGLPGEVMQTVMWQTEWLGLWCRPC